MYTIKYYEYDPKFETLDEMMIEENLTFEYDFIQPVDEKEFDSIMTIISHEGYLYELYKDDKFHASGVMTADSLYDDIM